MDAHFFRALAAEIGPHLESRRVEKVFAPAENVWTFVVQANDGRKYLLFRPAKSAGLFFMSAMKPVNPSTPPAKIMWLRKRLCGRRLFEPQIDWVNLKLAFTLSPARNSENYNYIIFDLKNGVSLKRELPEDFGIEPQWPAFEQIESEPEIWQQFPQISPPLRKHFSYISRTEAQELLSRLKKNNLSSFYLPREGSGNIRPPRVWQEGQQCASFTSAMEASAKYGERILFPLLEQQEEKGESEALKAGRKKYRKTIKRIEDEEKRLAGLQALKQKAELLQNELYRFKDSKDLQKVTVSHPEQGEVSIDLDPRLTPSENMARMFKLAAKAERGFIHMKRRRQEVEEKYEKLIENNLLPQQQDSQNKKITIPKKYKGMAASLFVSSDGFLIIRGKNSKANHEILSKAASNFDYWFHVADGPGSHVILKRDHPGHDVPQRTLEEAAVLAALKSYRSADSKAEVICALVKDIRKIKGASHGLVTVDNEIARLNIEIDPELDSKLTRKV
ncbi:NFACT RNA binding domain-containing protein [Maridesulfovibrio bastinii]|uniref:NFACT RNA binding domain-containing protein n=1 Tax=Maridesulfovibrio bastinii TaxID=47157 RepID=UPI0004097426|nr:NFACT RNA binding domain-containing protein [Maridesulfovibrio bastinii]